ncbi:MAG: CBS domain-containing protein [Chitinophagaceae bacterium]
MSIQALLVHDLPILQLSDTVQHALQCMHEFRVQHLAVVDRDQYIALVNEDDLLDYDDEEKPLGQTPCLQVRPMAPELAHPLQAVRLMKDMQLTVLPVCDEGGALLGVLTRERMFDYLANHQAFQREGAVVVLNMDPRQYSVAELARICESNKLQLTFLFQETLPESGRLFITFCVNQRDVHALLATLERFNYTVEGVWAGEESNEEVQANYNALMHYLNM